MRSRTPLPTAQDFGIDLTTVECPFCQAADISLESMTGDSAAELLVRCGRCQSFFFVMKEAHFIRGSPA